jgi:hypothetical protein
MNLDKFFTLLMGQCWHEFFNGSKYVTGCIHCKHHYGDAGDNPDHLSNPLPVLEWMRENMPDELDDYLEWCTMENIGVITRSHEALFFILDLKNIHTYLINHAEKRGLEWGREECPEETCIDGIIGYEYGKEIKCQSCNGSGTILHPALRYAKGEEG